ncbi:MAG TPA: hypothetical protein VGB00_15545 [Pyrinomonadaceae bacterium]
MRKHIPGFVLFSLIVGFSAGIYKLLSFMSFSQSLDIAVVQPSVKTFDKNSETEKAGKKSFKISQAVLYPKESEKNIDVELLANCEKVRCSGVHYLVNLYFFTKNESGTEFLGVEPLIFKPGSQNNEVYVTDRTVDSDWLEKLKPNDNLYVTLEKKANDVTEVVEDKASTDMSLAKSVLLVWGKKNKL